MEWLVGSLVMGPVLGLLAGGLFYFFKKAMGRKRPTGWTGKTRGGRFGNSFLKLVLRRLGLRAGYFCLYFIVPYFYIFAPIARRSLNEFWRQISPEMSWLARQWQLLRHFFTFGQVLMDRVYQSHNRQICFNVSSEGPVDIKKVVASQKGWVFIGAHVGGWDISSIFLERDKRTVRLGMVHYLAEGLTFDKVIDRREENFRVDSIPSNQGGGNSLLTVREYLQNQQHVGFLADRAMGSHVELISFLGKLAPFETRPFRVALACEAPLILTYNFKAGAKDYAFITAGVNENTSAPSRPLEILRCTQAFAKDLEEKVRCYPHQWFNFYPFWSAQPSLETKSRRRDNNLIEELQSPATPAAVQESAAPPIA